MRKFLALLLPGLLAAPIFAQSSPEAHAQVWLGVHAQIFATSQYSVHIQSTVAGEPDPYYAWLQNYASDLNTPVQSPNIMAQVYVGRRYSMGVSCGSWTYADVQFNVPRGYTLYMGQPYWPMTAHTTYRTDNYGGSFGDYQIDFELRPNDSAAYLGAGYSLAPALSGGNVLWSISAGTFASGRWADAIRWREASVSQDLLDAASLMYVAPQDDTVTTYQYSDGALKYIGTDQVQFYVRRNAGTDAGYTIEIYDPTVAFNYGGDPTNNDWTFYGTPWMKYVVSNPDPTWDGWVQVQRIDNASGQTDTWKVSQGEIVQTNSLRTITIVSQPNVPVAGERTETITTADNNGVIATKVQRVYESFVWGEEMISETDNPDGMNGPPLTTTYTYYTSGWVNQAFSGNVTKLQSVKYPDGSWVMYSYYDDFARWGELANVYRPWQDSPSDPSLANSGNCKFTTYNYTGERNVYQELSAGSTTTINGTTVAQETVSPSIWANGNYNTFLFGNNPVRQDLIQDYSASGVAQTTIRIVFHNTADPNYANRLYSQVNPDGTKVSASYVQGTLTDDTADTANWSATQFTPQSGGSQWCETYLYGTAGQGDPSAVQVTTDGMSGGKPVDPLWLTPYRSYRKQVVRDVAGDPILTMTQVFTGTGYQLISWEKDTYSSGGLMLSSQKSTGELSTWQYVDGHVSQETHPDGTQINNTFDALMRVTKSEKRAAGASGSYAAQAALDTTHTYDAAGRVLTTATQAASGGAALSTSSAYNFAGQLVSHSDATGLTTSYQYANGGRTVTQTLPGGAIQVTDRYADGQARSVTGNAIVNSFNHYTVNADGSITTETDIAMDGSPRWRKVTTDWLGRTTLVSQPSFGGPFNQQSVYNTSGQLVEVTETGKANTLYQYDGLGELQYSGLDVNGNGTLDLASMARVTEVRSQIVNQNGGWWKQSLVYIFNQDNNGTPLLQSEADQKLVPYDTGSGNLNADYAAGKGVHLTWSYDTNRNLTTEKVLSDPTTLTVTGTTTVPDSSVPAVSVSYNGLLVSKQTAQNLVTTYGYDSLGRQTQVVDPRIGATTTAYFTSGTGSNGQVYSVTDPAGDATTYGYDSTDGRLYSATNPLGKTVYHAYDSLGHEIETWGAATYPVSYTYDNFGQRVTMSTYRDGSGWSNASWPGTGTPDTTTWNYDMPSGMLMTKTDAAGHSVSYSYNARDQLATRNWARGVTTLYSYDPATAEQTGVSYSDGTPNLTYTYDRMGQTAMVMDVTGPRTFTYSPTTTQLQAETLSPFFNNRWVSRKYDTTAGALGRSTGFTLSGVNGSGADDDVTYGYDGYGRFDYLGVGGGPNFSYSYASASNLVAHISEASGWAESMTYLSNRNLLATVDNQFGGADKARFDYAYDAEARRTSVVKSGEEFNRYIGGGIHDLYNYDDRDELIYAQSYHDTNPGDSSTLVTARGFSYSFDNIGNRLTSAVDSTGDGYTANNLNQYVSRSHYPGLNVTGLAPSNATVTVNGTTAGRQGDYYSLWLGLANGSSSAWQGVNVSSNLGGSFSRSVWLPASPQAYTYDQDGNLTQDDRWTYTWDAENRLTSMTTTAAAAGVGAPNEQISFQYDYLGRRVRKTVALWNGSGYAASADTAYLYDGWNLIAEYSIAGGNLTPVRTYAWGLDLTGTMTDGGGVGGLLDVHDAATGADNLPAYDANGNVAALMDRGSGALTACYEYSPFGESIRATGTYAASNPNRFSSRYTDAETGLLYYGYRYYNPSLGRWLGRDPLEEKGGLNLYGFVNNNPVNLWDVLGRTIDVQETIDQGDSVDPAVMQKYHPGWKQVNDSTWYDPVADVNYVYSTPVVDGETDDLAGGNPNLAASAYALAASDQASNAAAQQAEDTSTDAFLATQPVANAGPPSVTSAAPQGIAPSNLLSAESGESQNLATYTAQGGPGAPSLATTSTGLTQAPNSQGGGMNWGSIAFESTIGPFWHTAQQGSAYLGAAGSALMKGDLGFAGLNLLASAGKMAQLLLVPLTLGTGAPSASLPQVSAAESTEPLMTQPLQQQMARSSTLTGGLGKISGGATTAENALTQAEEWLGPGYQEIAPGVFRSADGSLQFRMTTSDLTDPFQGPHVHFESIGSDGRTIIENSHVGIRNP